MGEQDAIFVVATDAGGMHGHCQLDDGGGGRAFGDEITQKDEVIVAGVVFDFGQ